MTILILLLSALGLAPTTAEAQPASCDTDEECYALCLSQGALDCDAEYFGTLGDDE